MVPTLSLNPIVKIFACDAPFITQDQNKDATFFPLPNSTARLRGLECILADHLASNLRRYGWKCY